MRTTLKFAVSRRGEAWALIWRPYRTSRHHDFSNTRMRRQGNSLRIFALTKMRSATTNSASSTRANNPCRSALHPRGAVSNSDRSIRRFDRLVVDLIEIRNAKDGVVRASFCLVSILPRVTDENVAHFVLRAFTPKSAAIIPEEIAWLK